VSTLGYKGRRGERSIEVQPTPAFFNILQQNLGERKQVVPPTMNNAPVIQKLAYIHKIKMANSPTIKSPGV